MSAILVPLPLLHPPHTIPLPLLRGIEARAIIKVKLPPRPDVYGDTENENERGGGTPSSKSESKHRCSVLLLCNHPSAQILGAGLVESDFGYTKERESGRTLFGITSRLTKNRMLS